MLSAAASLFSELTGQDWAEEEEEESPCISSHHRIILARIYLIKKHNESLKGTSIVPFGVCYDLSHRNFADIN
jgi:hypothetical protein